MADDNQGKPPCPIHDDHVVPLFPTPTGGSACLVHTKDHQLSIGEMRPVIPGMPIPDDARFAECNDGKWTIHETVRDLKTQSGPKLAGGTGPAQVATDDYRDSWERTFGKKHFGQA